MADHESKNSPFSFDGRSLAQWVVTYAIVVWFVLEVLDFLIGIYGGSTLIVRTATTFGITSFSLLFTMYWFVGKQKKGLSGIPANLAMFASILLISMSTLRTGVEHLDWLAVFAVSLGFTCLVIAALATTLKLTGRSSHDSAAVSPIQIPEQNNSIAVLPFRSLSASEEDSYFAEGLAEEILNSLARIPDLQVASRSSSFAIPPDSDTKTTGSKLNVNYVLEGSVRKSGEKLRVSVQLTQVLDGYAMWAKTYNSILDDIFEVQDQIAERVASALKSTLWESVVGQQAQHRTSNSDAYKEYLLAMHYDRNMHQGGTEELEKVRLHAEKAVELDSQFVPAWILLADVYLNRMGYRLPKSEAHELARSALSKALELEPNNPDVILQLAELARGDHKYEEALALYKNAKDLDQTSPQVDYATLLYTVGNLDAALKEFEHCIDRDPENFSLWYYYASALLSKGETASSLRNYTKALQIAADGFLADGVRATLAGITYLYSDAEQGKQILEPCLAHNPNRIDFEHGLIAGIQGLMGDKATAQKVATDLELRVTQEYIDPQALFWVHFGIDAPDRDRLFHWMSKMIEEDSFPSIYFLKTWPPLEKYRDDRRYQTLLETAGF